MFYNGLGSILRGRGFEVVLHPFRKHPDAEIKLPTRSDNNSAGYDFYTPVDIVIEPQGRVLVWTDVKAYMQDNEVLMLYIRSSIGVKQGVVLSNGTGVIDASYYSNPDNDGRIGISLFNTSDKEVQIKAGERIAQGVFIQYLVADDDNVLNKERIGGFGSSGK